MNNNLPYGTTVGEFSVLHEGNHGDKGNPHPQYETPVFYMSKASDAKSQNMYTKIISTPVFTTTARLHVVADVFSDAASAVYDHMGTFTISAMNTDVAYASYHNKHKEKYTNLDLFDLIKVYRRTINGLKGGYVYDVYFKVSNINEVLKFIPHVSIFQNDYHNALDYCPRAFDTMYLEYQPLIDINAENSPVKDDTLLCTNTVDNAIINAPYLPAPDAKYSDKIFCLKNDNSKMFTCVNNLSTYQWRGLGNGALSKTDTNTTIDLGWYNTSIGITHDSAVSITNFINGYEGMEIMLLCNDANTTIVYGTDTIRVKGSTKVTIPKYGWMKFRKFNAVWFEMARSF